LALYPGLRSACPGLRDITPSGWGSQLRGDGLGARRLNRVATEASPPGPASSRDSTVPPTARQRPDSYSRDLADGALPLLSLPAAATPLVRHGSGVDAAKTANACLTKQLEASRWRFGRRARGVFEALCNSERSRRVSSRRGPALHPSIECRDVAGQPCTRASRVEAWRASAAPVHRVSRRGGPALQPSIAYRGAARQRHTHPSTAEAWRGRARPMRRLPRRGGAAGTPKRRVSRRGEATPHRPADCRGLIKDLHPLASTAEPS